MKDVFKEPKIADSDTPEPPAEEWKEYAEIGGSFKVVRKPTATINAKINKKVAKPDSEYKDATDTSNGRLSETIVNSGSKVFKFFMQSGRIGALEKEYSGYGARQLYYNVDKEEDGLDYITACSTLLGLQLHVSKIEDKMNKEEIEEINKLNARALSLDDEGDDKGPGNYDAKVRAYRIGLGNNGKKPLAGQGTSNNNWKLKRPVSDRLQESGNGTGEESDDEDREIIESYWIESTEYVKIQHISGISFWVTRGWRDKGHKGAMYIPSSILKLLPST